MGKKKQEDYDKITEGKDHTIEELCNIKKGSLTEEIVSKLVEALKTDATIEEACSYAGIRASSYYNYCKWSSEFVEKMESARQFLFLMAKSNWAVAIANKKDVEASVKFLERRQKERYSTRVESVVAEVDYDDLIDGLELDDKYKPEELEEAEIEGLENESPIQDKG